MKTKRPSKSTPLIKWAKEQKNNTHGLGVQLEIAERRKNAAIRKEDYKAAARYRQQEVELMEQIEILMAN
jgi:hypothetical protein